MSKRRRMPSIASRSVDDDANESDSQSTSLVETTRKKRKLDPVSNAFTSSRIYCICFKKKKNNKKVEKLRDVFESYIPCFFSKKFSKLK